MLTPKKLNPDVVNILNPFLTDEFTAFYTYRAAENWCRGVGFFIAADYFKKESEDELEHAKKIEQYLVDWNVMPILPIISPPPIQFQNLRDVIEVAYGLEYSLYEKYEQGSINVLDLDTTTFGFLQFFRDVQRTSVAEYSDMLNQLEGIDATDKFKMLQLEETLFGEG